MKFKILLIFMVFVNSQAFGKNFVVCMEPKGVFPLYQERGKERGNSPGLYFEMLKFLDKKLRLRTKVKRRPFKRCLSSLKAGRVDAVASASYKEYRKEFGVYPQNVLTCRVVDGDKSDGIPGVLGIGVKTLVKEFPNLTEDKDFDTKDMLDSAKSKSTRVSDMLVKDEYIVKRNYILINSINFFVLRNF